MKFEKFRKNPVVIEAFQLTKGVLDRTWKKINKNNLYNFTIREKNVGFILFGGEPIGLVIPTLEGNHDARIDDWIIQGVKGELYPCKPDVFKKTYEKV